MKGRALVTPTETSATAGAVEGLLGSMGDKYADVLRRNALQGVQRRQHGLVRRHRRRARREGRHRVRHRGLQGHAGVSGRHASGRHLPRHRRRPSRRTGRRATSSSACAARWARRSRSRMLRPKKGSTNERRTEKTFTLTRATINYPNLKSEMIGKVGYMRLGQFNANAEKRPPQGDHEPDARRARSRSCSTCAATRAACWTRRWTSPRSSSRTA